MHMLTYHFHICFKTDIWALFLRCYVNAEVTVLCGRLTRRNKSKMTKMGHAFICQLWTLKRSSLHMSQVAHQAGAYPGFNSMKQLGVFLLPPGWDASPLQGYPPAVNSPVSTYTSGSREAPCLARLPRNTTQCPRSGLEPRALSVELSALSIGHHASHCSVVNNDSF